MAQPEGGSRARPRTTGTAMIATAPGLRRKPGGGRGPRSMQLVRPHRAEQRARTGDRLHITKALLIRER
jgi:hypothetical protein